MIVKIECKQSESEPQESNFLESIMPIEQPSSIRSVSLRTYSDRNNQTYDVFNHFLNKECSKEEREEYQHFYHKIQPAIENIIPSYRRSKLQKMKYQAVLFYKVMNLMNEPITIKNLKLLITKLNLQNQRLFANIPILTKENQKKIHDRSYLIRNVLIGCNLIIKKDKKTVMLVHHERNVQAPTESTRSNARQYYKQQLKQTQLRVQKKQKHVEKLQKLLQTHMKWTSMNISKNKQLIPKQNIIEYPFVYIREQNLINYQLSKRSRSIIAKIDSKSGIVNPQEYMYHLQNFNKQKLSLRHQLQNLQLKITRKRRKMNENQFGLQQIIQQESSFQEKSQKSY